MLSLIRARWQGLLYSLWFFPGLTVASLAALSLLLRTIDRELEPRGPLVFGGDPDVARQTLTVVAGSIVTVAGVTFSVTIVVLQLVSSQFSPRLLRNFLRDRVTQLTAGVFIGTFVYSLLVLSEVREGGDGSTRFVPGLSVTVAIALGLVSFALLLFFVNHMAQSVQVSSMAAGIGRDASKAIEALYPSRYGRRLEEDGAGLVDEWWRDATPTPVRAPRSGYVQKLNVDDVVKELPDSQLRLAIDVCPGDFVTEATVLMNVWADGALDEEVLRDVRRAVNVAPERDIGQDAAFAVRQLADIAVKAISPSINDPTTAVTCIGHIRAALAQLATRELPAFVRTLDDRNATVVARRREFDEHLEAFVEISRYASKDARVIEAVLDALAEIARAAVSAGAVERQRGVADVAAAVAAPALEDARSERDRERIERALAAVKGARQSTRSVR